MNLASRQIYALRSASAPRSTLLRRVAVPSTSSSLSVAAGRSASTSAAVDRGRFRETKDEDAEDLDDSGDITFQSWLKDIGEQYKDPKPGLTNYLGGDCPFPMNPSFKPPPPLSANFRQTLFNLHISDPEQNSIRELSQRFGLSLKRVEAVIRLKGEEVKWEMEGRPLRKNFERVMESTLGVKQAKAETLSIWNTHGPSQLADKDADTEGPNTAEKKGIEKLWWEGVEDGEEPVVGPHLLARAAELAKKAAQAETERAQFAASHSRVVESTVPGRAPTVFIDVGKKFMDPKDEAKRQKAAEARHRLKAKKAVA